MSVPLPLAGERLSFTGTLASMTHKQASERVEENGGTATEHVSRQTTMLVVGEEGWPLESDGQPSVKLQQVQRMREAGLDIKIVSESDWLTFVGLDGRKKEINRVYTPAMLSQLLGVSVHQIRRWERMGLIRAVSHVYRLPYFDFQEVSSARRLADLLADGVPVREIQNSLTHLRDVVGGIDRPLAQLEILARDHQVLYRDSHGRLKTPVGQRLFDFDGPPPAEPPEDSPPLLALPRPDTTAWTAADWFAEGRRLAEEDHLADAVEAFRMSLMQDADAPEVHFHLADALYRIENLRGALERYHVAAELDHNYLEAWTQIGCLHLQLGEPDPALDAFHVALDIHPDCPEAHLHLAETLDQLVRPAEAEVHWRKYLAFDQRGPWADKARQRLGEDVHPSGEQGM